MTAEAANRNKAGQQAAETRIGDLRVKGGPFVAAVEATRMPMVVTDPGVEGNPIIYANAAFLEMCGYALDEVLGQNYLFLSGEDTDPQFAGRLRAAMSARSNLVEEVRFRRKDGTPIWVAAFVSPVVEDGHIVQHFASFLDITRRVEAERDLADAKESLEQRIAARTRELETEVERRARLEAVLMDTLAQREQDVRHQTFLAREVDHRAKNALQMASAMLLIQAGKSQDTAVIDALRSAVGRLNRMAEVHALLYQGKQPGLVDMAAYLRHLVRVLGEALEPRPGQVQFHVDAGELVLDADLAVPLGLLVGEAVTNAMKHAFPGGRTGNVTVTLRTGGDGLVRVRVEDDGVGLPSSRREGALGLELVQAFADKVRGEVSLGPGAAGGTCVLLVFPVARAN